MHVHSWMCGDICCFGPMCRIQEDVDGLSRQNVPADNGAS